MKWMTFADWQIYEHISVKKGEKSILREPVTNLPLFSELQVTDEEDDIGDLIGIGHSYEFWKD